MAYLPLSTANLPDPAIDPAQDVEPRDYFETFLYTGNGGGLQVGDVIKKPADTTDITNSLIFNQPDTHYLSRTPSASTETNSATTFTVSCWFKPTANSTDYQNIWMAGDSGTANRTFMRYNSAADDKKILVASDDDYVLTTPQKLLDTSRWYHIVVAVDTRSSVTQADRVKVWVDGVQQALTGTQAGADVGTRWNQNKLHYIGNSTYTSGRNLDGYLAEFHNIDGIAYDHEDFGNFDANGIWIPKTVSGLTYGDNGFYLDFSDNTSTTTLGADQAGSNDWTLNNFATTDQVADSPTDNFATFDPNRTNGVAVTLSEGNLVVVGGSNWGNIALTQTAFSGKYYVEFSNDSAPFGTYANVRAGVGVATKEAFESGFPSNVWGFGGSGTVSYYDGGQITENFSGSTLPGGGASEIWNQNDVIGVAVDFDTSEVSFYKQGTLVDTVTLIGKPYYIGATTYGGQQLTLNAGQRSFTYTPPTGYLALSEDNITVDDQNLESPNWVWIKNRDQADDHKLFTTLRGVQKSLEPNEATDEADEPNTLVDFNKNGFTIGDDVTVNTSGEDYVAWCWANISESWSNDASATGIGDYDSSGIRSGKTGVSIFTYAGKGTGSTSIRNKFAHGLVDENGTAVIPELFWFKGIDTGTTYGGWMVQGNAFDDVGSGGGDILKLNTNAARTSNAASANTQWTNQWVELDYSRTANLNGTDNICFAFRSVEGFSKIGTYVGNESATAGPFTYTGFKPAWVMVKNISTTGSWVIHDNKRTPNNSFTTASGLSADVTTAESTDTTLRADFLSNGFVMYSGSNSYNNSGSTYLYMAFAEQPFKYSNAR